VIGRWEKVERQWVKTTYRRFGAPAPTGAELLTPASPARPRARGTVLEVTAPPPDGLSARSVEDGEERISREAPESVDLLVRLLQSYAAGDDRWRTMIAWDS
jgi:hypothetical protein